MGKKAGRLCLALIILMLAFIWGNSLMPPQMSWKISDTVQNVLSHFTPVEDPAGAGSGFWRMAVRKLAHFTEFFLLGGLLSAGFRRVRKSLCPPLLTGVLVALTDETIQYYTGRTSNVLDVWIDFVGIAIGVLLVAWHFREKSAE